MTATGTETSGSPEPGPTGPLPKLGAKPPRRASASRSRSAKSTPKQEAAGKRETAPARPERRYVQTIHSIDIWSVCKMSVVFYLCALIVALCAGVVLWWIAVAFGAVGNVEKFIGDLFNNRNFHLISWAVLRTMTLVGLAFVCVATVITVLTAALYNLFAEVFGGIEVTIAEQEGPVA